MERLTVSGRSAKSAIAGSVVVPAGEDSNLVLLHLVHKAMFAVDPPGPATLQLVLQGLGFAGAGKRFPLNVAD